MTLYVGLAGKAGAGKNYLADWFETQIAQLDKPRSSEQLAFAHFVRWDIEEAFGGDQIPELWAKPTDPLVRKLLQWWGTDYRRNQDPDFWVKKGIQMAEEISGSDAGIGWWTPGLDIVFFTDVRFANEARAIQRKGGISILVEAGVKVRESRIGEVPDHASEQIDVPWDFKVINQIDGAPPMVSFELWRLLAYGEGEEVFRERARLDNIR